MTSTDSEKTNFDVLEETMKLGMNLVVAEVLQDGLGNTSVKLLREAHDQGGKMTGVSILHVLLFEVYYNCERELLEMIGMVPLSYLGLRCDWGSVN